MTNDSPFIPVNSQEYEPRLLCPVCGDSYVHPVVLTCTPPGSSRGALVVASQGTYLNPAVPPQDRGVRITLRFSCEQGHAFTYTIQFHKGETFVGKIMEAPADDEPVIWRT